MFIYLCWISLGNINYINIILLGMYLIGAYSLLSVIEITNKNGHSVKDVKNIKNTLGIRSKVNVQKD